MKTLKIVLPCILSFVLIFAPIIPVGAENSARMRNDSLVAGYHLAEVIDLILTRYMGEDITADDLLVAALHGMASILDDYSVYMCEEELRFFADSITGSPLMGIGIVMQLEPGGIARITNVLPDTPAEEVGIMPGDIILYIDGEATAGRPLDFISALIANPETDRVIMDINRNRNRLTFDVEKVELRMPTIMVHKAEDVREAQGVDGIDKFAVIQIRSVGLSTAEDIRRAIASLQTDGVEGIILDLRNNSGGYLEATLDVANQLVPEGIVFQMVNNLGEKFIYSSDLEEAPFEHMVVLVNRFTASAAEVIASALQDSGAATLVGEPTFGKGLVQSIYSLRAGGVLKLTTEEYFRRNGGTIDGVGVRPCIALSSRQRLNAQDFVLRRGFEVLSEKAE